MLQYFWAVDKNVRYFYSPALTELGYTGFLYPHFWKSGAILDLGCPSVCHSVRHNFVFRSISWEQIVIIFPNFIYALILIRIGFVTHPFSPNCNRVMALDWLFLRHEKRCSGAIVRFSDNSSCFYYYLIIIMYLFWDKQLKNARI